MRGMKLGLAAIDAVCERLGRPERRVSSVLIAGTNGKGSTAATLASIAAAGGLAAGLYTSPHLIDVTERIRLGSEDISPEELDAALGVVFTAADRAPKVPLTYFEAMTAAAFEGFARRGLDIAVLEVGLGGRLDATNVVPAALSAITSISLDHTEELGATIESIAFEKAGIFRSGRPALVEGPREEAREVLRTAASGTGAILHEMAAETTLEPEAPSLSEMRFRLTTPQRDYELATPLLGVHQAANAAVAVRAAELLSSTCRIAPAAIVQGVRRVRWPGRLEKFRARNRTVLLDGCHNLDGARSLASFVAGAKLNPDLVFGAMADKDIEGMAGELAPVVRGIRLVPVPSPRGATPSELARRFAGHRSDATAARDLTAALEGFLTDPGSETIIVAGSLYLVGEARALLLSGRFDRAT
ncbi:MAG TPA: Mur ligase family protein [Thermoanaerobaculia bacterium]